MKKKFLLLVTTFICLTLIISLSACSGSGTSSTEDSANNSASSSVNYSDTITVGTTMVFTDANRQNYNYDVLSGSLTQLSLISLLEDGSFLPSFASYNTSSDGLTWTFNVVDNLKWHDGKDATADDILFTFNYSDAIDGTNYLVDATTTDGVVQKMFESATVSEDKTSLQVVLKETNARLLSSLTTLKIMPKHIYSNEQVNYIPYKDVSDEDSRIGCGPFRFLSYSNTANTLSFIYSETWTNYVPSVKKVIFKTYSEDTVYLAVMTGEVDMIYNYSTGISPTYTNFLIKNNSLSFKSIQTEALPAVLAFNTDGTNNLSDTKELIKNVNFRKAVRYALDYEKIVNTFSSSYGKVPNAGIVSNATIGYSETSVLSRDLNEAKSLIEGLGATKTADEVYYKINGVEVKFNIAYRTNKKINSRIVEMITENLKDAGIKVTSTPYSTLGEYQSLLSSRNYDAVLFGATAYGVSNKAGLGSIYFDYNNTTQGISQVNTSEYDEILANLSTSIDLDKYLAAAAECQKYYANYIPAIALYYDSMIQVYNKKLDGFSVDKVYGLINVNTFKTLTKKN